MTGSGRFLARSAVVSRALWQRAIHPLRRPPARVRRVLVAHHLLLGDTLMLSPLLATLRAKHPDADIVMTTPVAFEPLYRTRPWGVRAIPFHPARLATHAPLFAGDGFDIAYVPGDNRFSWLALAAGARWIVAFDGDRPAYKSWPVDDARPYPNVPGAWGDMVAGLVNDIRMPAWHPADWPAPAHRPFAMPPVPYAVLHVGASTPLKQWRTERWSALARWMRDVHGWQPVLLGGPGEGHLIDAIDPSGEFARHPGDLDLAQVWHLLCGARMLVCPDTGIAHLGRITGTPTVTLFGPGSAMICGAGDFWHASPWRGVTVDPFECRDQQVLFKRTLPWVRRCGRTTRECADPRCMHAIDVAAVQQAVTALAGPANGRSL